MKLCSNLGNEGSDMGFIKFFRGPQVPHYLVWVLKHFAAKIVPADIA